MRRRRLIAAAAGALALLAPAAAQAAGPTAVAVDSGGTVYAGFESGAVKRYQAPDGTELANWPTPVANANGALGAIVAIDVAPAEGVHNGGGVWVLDANRRVQEWSRDGAFVRGFRLRDCESSTDPVPAAKGGLDVTATAIYVAHPCANLVERFPLAALPAAGMGSPPSERAEVYSPHGIAAPPSLPAAPGTGALYVTQPRSSAVRRYDLSTLGQLGDAAPITHTGSPDDVVLGGAGGVGRVLVSETQNPAAGYAHRIYAFEPAGGDAFTEIFNLGGLGAAPGQLNGAASMDAVEGGLAASVVVADRSNERVQRLTAASPSDAGNVVWAAAAADPGPPPVPPTGQANAGGGGGGAGGGGGGGAGRGAVSINDGARFTATPEVLLRISEPAGASAIEISHRASFGSRVRVPAGTQTLDWELLVDEPDRVRRRVFVRFPGAGREAVSDEIRLDRRRPRVRSVRIVRGKSGAVLRVLAADSSSGLAELQLAAERKGPYEPRAFRPRTRIESVAAARYVRVADGVGNVSDTARSRRAP